MPTEKRDDKPARFKPERSFWLTGNGLAAIALIAFAAYFLLIEHRQHLTEWLPLLILLLCPLMHIFMHRGHGHGHGGNHKNHDRTHGDTGK
jgi:drug/metabolite transporter (DMT)-like permease